MITPELQEYVRQALADGQSRETIARALRQEGWDREDIESTLGRAAVPTPDRFPTVYRLTVQAWQLYRSRLSTLAVLVVVAVVATAAAQWLLTGTLNLGTFVGVRPASPQPMGVGESVAYFTLNVVNLYVYLLALIVLVNPQPLTVLPAARISVNKLLPLLGVLIVSAAIIVGGFFPLVVPGLIFLIWFGMAMYVYLDQGIGGLRALRVSKEYTRGYFWQLWWRYLAFLVVFFIVYVGIAGIFYVLGAVGGVATAAAALLGMYALTLFSLLSIAYNYHIYLALRERKGTLAEVPRATAPLVVGTVGFILLLALVIFGSFAVPSSQQSSASGTAQQDIEKVVVLNILKAAAEDYYSRTGSFPASLQVLEADYLRAGTVNFADYTYAAGTAPTDRKICTSLSTGEQQCVEARQQPGNVSG